MGSHQIRCRWNKMVSLWRVVLAVLAIVDGIFHFLLKGSGPLTTTGGYFLFSGILLIVGALFVLLQGAGSLFTIGAYGLIVIAIIDDALLYLTRTYGLRFLSPIMGGSFGHGFPNGNFTRSGNFSGFGNSTRIGNFTGPGGAGFVHGFGRGIPWSTTWIPPGAIQTFVLQALIIVVAIGAIVAARSMKKVKKPPTDAGASAPSSSSTNSS